MVAPCPTFVRVLAQDFSNKVFTTDKDKDVVSIRHQLGTSGAALLSLQQEESIKDAQEVVKEIFQATNVETLEEITEPTVLQTNFPQRAEPPRLSALYVVEGSDSVVVALARFSKVVGTFQPLLASALRTDLVFTNDDKNNGTTTKSLPLLDTSYRGRLTPGMLLEKDSFDLSDVHVDFITRLEHETLLPPNQITVQAGSLLVFDNCYLAHSILPSSSSDSGSAFKVARFCFHPVNPPELDATLAEGANHVMWKWEDEPGAAALNHAAWPLRTKAEFATKIAQAYREHYLSAGTKNIYWGASSGTTAQGKKPIGLPSSFTEAEDEATLAFINHHLPRGKAPLIPASFPEVNEQRLMLCDLYADSGTFDSNSTIMTIVIGERGFRALEVQSQLFYNLSLTHLPVGHLFTTQEYISMILTYGVTHVMGMTTVLVEIAIYMKRHNIFAPTLQGFVFAGEDLTDRGVGALEKVTQKGQHAKVLGFYGSSEVGLFAVRNPGQDYYYTWSDGMSLDIVNDEGESVPIGQVGELVQTNLLRRREPMIRYKQGDMARFLDESRTKFQLAGRKHDSLFYDFGTKNEKTRVYWSQVRAALVDYLDEAFDGFVLFQLWIQKTTTTTASTSTSTLQDVTLAVSTYEMDKDVLKKVAQGAIERLEKVLPRDKCGIRDMTVEWVDDGSKLLRLWTQKLNCFVVLQD